MNQNQRLELTWIGKGEKINPEPCILLYDEANSYGGSGQGQPPNSWRQSPCVEGVGVGIRRTGEVCLYRPTIQPRSACRHSSKSPMRWKPAWTSCCPTICTIPNRICWRMYKRCLPTAIPMRCMSCSKPRRR